MFKRVFDFFVSVFVSVVMIGCSTGLLNDDFNNKSLIEPKESELTAELNKSYVSKNFTSVSQVADFVKKHGYTWEWSDSGNVNLVVIRGAGSYYKPTSTYADNIYDDLFVVVTKSGSIYEYDRGNGEGTTLSSKISQYNYTNYKDPNLKKYCTPAISPGLYKLKVDLHDGYKALHTYGYTSMSRENLPSQKLNGNHDHFHVNYVNVHKGYDNWTGSVGCMTLHYSQYDSFISHFTSGAWGRTYVIGNYNEKIVINSNWSYSNNAQVVGDFFYVRDGDGDIISGREVWDGDKITVLKINYDKQLCFVEYPTSSGVREGWITNATNIIKYTYLKQWKNGSTNETVYDENGNNIGTIYPNEYATPLYRKNGKLCIVYDTSKGARTKSGFVVYNGGFSKF